MGRSRSLMVVTVTVWFGWSHCMDSDFAVTSWSRSSPPQTTSVSHCRPLQVLLRALLSELLFCCLSHCWISSMAAFFCPASHCGCQWDIPRPSFSLWELSTSQCGHLLASSCCRPYLVGLPRFQLSKMRDAMGFCTLILALYYTVLLFPTVFWCGLYSFYRKNHIIYKKISILLHSQFGCLLFLPLAWVLWLGLQ